MKTGQPMDADLRRIWRAIQKDKDGARALALLKKDGFDLGRLAPDSYSWTGIIASLPFLPNRRARSRVLARPTGLRLTIRFMRELEQALTNGYSRVEAYHRGKKITHSLPSPDFPLSSFRQTVEFLEQVTSCKWVVIEHNPLQNKVATLRWATKWRTKKAHDKELHDLIDAGFRAAGFREGFSMEFESFKKVEVAERDTRQAGRRKLYRQGL